MLNKVFDFLVGVYIIIHTACVYDDGIKEMQGTGSGFRHKVRVRNLCNSKDINPIVVYGEPSSGKTFLAKLIDQELEKHGKSAYRMTCESLVCSIIDGIKNSEFRDNLIMELSSFDLVIIDEIEELKSKQGTQHEVAIIVYKMVEAGTKVILMGLPGADKYDELKKTLFSYGISVKEMTIRNMTRSERYLLIKERSNALGIKLPVAGMWRMSKETDPRSILGMLQTLKLFTCTELMEPKSELTVDDMRRFLGTQFSE